jgi:hypothetical protein
VEALGNKELDDVGCVALVVTDMFIRLSRFGPLGNA